MIKPGQKKDRGKCPLCGKRLVSLGGLVRCPDHRKCNFVENRYDHDSIKMSDRKSETRQKAIADTIARSRKRGKKSGRPAPPPVGNVNEKIDFIRELINREKEEEAKASGEMPDAD